MRQKTYFGLRIADCGLAAALLLLLLFGGAAYGQKTSALTALTTPADGDYLEILDVSDTTMAVTGTNKKITFANFKTGLSLQAADADLDIYAGITPSSNVQTLLGAADFAAFKTSLSLGNVENTALSTWAGTANITTLGTVTTGTFSGILDGTVTLTLGSDATGDIYYRNASGFLTRLAIGTNGQVLTVASGLPSWATGGAGLTSTDIDTSAELAAILTDESGASGGFVRAAVTDALDTRLDTVETDVWDITDPAANAFVIWNDSTNEVEVATFGTGISLSTGAITLDADLLDLADGTLGESKIDSTIARDSEVAGTQTGVHATPSTSNPLAPTWTGLMHTVWYGATGEIDLPAASGYTGRSILIYNTGAFTVTIDPNGSEVIVRDGTVQTGGVTMTLSTGAGNYVGLISDGARWITLGYKGTLAVGS